MLITRQVDYAMRLLRALADQKSHKIPDLCESEMIPSQFAYQIMRKLSAAEYVASTRGAHGGTRLNINLEEVSLLELLELLEDDPGLSACTRPGYECALANSRGGCMAHEKLCELQEQIAAILNSVKLADLLAPPSNDSIMQEEIEK